MRSIPRSLFFNFKLLRVLWPPQSSTERMDGAVEAPPIARHREGDTLKHFYIAVDRLQFKMGTLFDLLELFWKRSGVPLVICCSARDALDAVFTAVGVRPQFSARFLHSDLCDQERASILDDFYRAMTCWRKSSLVDSVPEKLVLLVVTDACLPSSLLGEHSLSARVVINYDLPLKKEAYLRRLSSCTNSTASSGIVLNMVVGAEVSALKNLEEGLGTVMDEMPINIIELL